MYIFGIDIPLVELILAMGVITIILLLEITVLLVLVSFHLRNSKKLGKQIALLTSRLLTLEGREKKDIEKTERLAEKEKELISRLKKKKK